jgi:hypothetical protein
MRAFIALGVTLLLSASVARAEVIWRGDFETSDLSQWTKSQLVAPDRMQVVDSPVRQGKHALRVEVRQGDDPINASGDRAELVGPTETEGNDRYYAWSTQWATDYPSVATWQAFTQWHHTGNTGTPPLEMYVNGESMHLAIRADESVVWTHPLERGAWHDFILHVKWSSDPGVGFVELWYDGKQVLGKTTGETMYPGQDNIMKQGLYRNDTIAQVGVLYHDGMTAATSLEDVLPKPATNPAPTPAPTAPPTSTTPPAPPDSTATGTGGVAAADNSAAPAGSGGCSVASASGSGGLGGACGLALALLGISVALRRKISYWRRGYCTARSR